MNIDDALVPVDFRPSSLQALSFAVELMEGRGEVHLLHVIDSEFLEQAVDQGLGERAELAQRLTARADEKLAELVKGYARDELEVHPVVVVGNPFVEIVRLAKDLDFQVIVMGTHGRHLDNIEHALFGSTAERVIRTANRPVICVPYRPEQAAAHGADEGTTGAAAEPTTDAAR